MGCVKLSDKGGTAQSGSYNPDGSAKSAFGPEARTTSGAGTKNSDDGKGKKSKGGK
jgi:hypothetical protein